MATAVAPIKEMWIRRATTAHVEGGHLTALQSHLIAASGEFVGTFFFLWMAYSGHLMVVNQTASVATAGSGASSETVVFVSLAYGFSLLVNAWAFYRISGGLFNPAVCILPVFIFSSSFFVQVKGKTKIVLYPINMSRNDRPLGCTSGLCGEKQ